MQVAHVAALASSGDPTPRAGFAIHVDALCIDTHLELKTLLGQPVLLELLTQASRFALRPFHGHVTRISLLGSDGGLARYRLVIEPWLAFASYTQDSRVFQSMSVPAIVDAVFGAYVGKGRLAPAWRWDLADASVYPERSLCVQYQESDFDFVTRLLSEEGIVWWFEHEGAPMDAALGAHTLVLADHVRRLRAERAARRALHAVGRVDGRRQPGALSWVAARDADSRRCACPAPTTAPQVRWRCRRRAPMRSAMTALELQDVPGQYAFEDRTQGERLALRRQQALDARAAVGVCAWALARSAGRHDLHAGRSPRARRQRRCA